MSRAKKFLVSIVFILLAAIVVGAFLILRLKPSHEREWELGQEVLPQVTQTGDMLTFSNLRDFKWTDAFEAEAVYREGVYDLGELTRVDVIISHFDDFEGLAHIFLSFVFNDGENLVVSLESRREKGEVFSPFWGMLRSYERMYVLATEDDVIGVRTDYRGERVYRYTTTASREASQRLLLELVEDVNALYLEPEFYNTLTNNCTNGLTRRVEEISDVRFPFTYKTLLPGYFDEVLYTMNLIPSSKPFSEIKELHRIPGT